MFLFFSCNKDKNQPSGYLEEYISLEASDDTLMVNETTTITAIAKGMDLQYLWFADGGVFIEKNGNSVTYSAPDCSSGNKEISCTIKAENRSETKKVYIYVK